MRIHDAYTKPLGVHTPPPGAPTAGARGAHEHAPSGGTDSVRIKVSDEARALAARAESGVDEAKVARLRAALEDGSFRVDSGAIAEKLVGPEQ